MSSTTVTRHRSPRRIRDERGIYHGERKDGSRLYEVYFDGGWVTTEADGTPLLTIVAARERRGELIGSTRRGEKPVRATKTTFAEVAEAWYESKARGRRSNTLACYRQALDLVLIPHFGKQKVVSISADAIVELIKDLEQRGLNAIDPKRPLRPLSGNTIKNYLKPLSGTLKLAVRRDLITRNPCDLLTNDERPRQVAEEQTYEWSEEAITGLLDASALVTAGRPNHGNDYTPILRLAATSGLRIGEILGLKWGDFDRAAGTISIERQWLRNGSYGPPKTRAGRRVIPVTKEVRDALISLRLASKFSQDGDPIFATKTGRAMDARSVVRWGFYPARDLAGLPASVTFHDLRHAAASRLIAKPLDPVTVAAVLGHEDPSVTLRVYAHLFSARKDKQAETEAIRAAMDGSLV